MERCDYHCLHWALFFVIMFLEYHFLLHIFMVIMHWCFLFLHKTNKNKHLMDTQQTLFQLLFTPLCVWLFSMNGGPLSYPHLHFQSLRQVKKRTLKCSWRNAKPFEPWSDWPNRLNWKAAGWCFFLGMDWPCLLGHGLQIRFKMNFEELWKAFGFILRILCHCMI